MVINLDRNASYGLYPAVAAALEKVLASGALELNPSSVHRGGQSARALVEEARATLNSFLDIDQHAQLVFTSGATEANNTALIMPFLSQPTLSQPFSAALSVAGANDTRAQLIVAETEHPSILEPAARLERLGVKVTRYHRRAGEAFDIDKFLATLCSQTRLVSLMLANNESGEIFPVSEVARRVKQISPSILVHSDAVQAVGKMRFSFRDLGVDMLTISAHKLGGLSGVGALVIRDGVLKEGLMLGGPQELHMRAGTENVLGIISFALAAKECLAQLPLRIERMSRHKSLLLAKLRSSVSGVCILGEGVVSGIGKQIPNTINVRVPGVRADDLVVALDLKGVRISSGAACASGKPDPSHVLLALGLGEKHARESIRISLGGEHSEAEIERACEIIVSTIHDMQMHGRAEGNVAA